MDEQSALVSSHVQVQSDGGVVTPAFLFFSSVAGLRCVMFEMGYSRLAGASPQRSILCSCFTDSWVDVAQLYCCRFFFNASLYHLTGWPHGLFPDDCQTKTFSSTSKADGNHLCIFKWVCDQSTIVLHTEDTMPATQWFWIWHWAGEDWRFPHQFGSRHWCQDHCCEREPRAWLHRICWKAVEPGHSPA